MTYQLEEYIFMFPPLLLSIIISNLIIKILWEFQNSPLSFYSYNLTDTYKLNLHI